MDTERQAWFCGAVKQNPPEETEPQADFAFIASLLIVGTVIAWVAVAVVGIAAR